MRKFNIITATDSYKVDHWQDYPEGLQILRSYLEARAGAKYPYTVFFGLQYIIKEYLTGAVVTKKKIDEAERKFNKHFLGAKLFNRAGWEYILKEHGGKLPISIRAVKEGTIVPIGNALICIENTDPNCAWLVNYLETLLVQVWYPITVCTRSHYLKQVILAALEKSGDPNGIMFKLHDFGFRGVTCVEQAGIGGGAHLINFWGTDTFAGIEFLEEYYQGDGIQPLGYPGFSIPATEHSTITSWKLENELAAVRNFVEKHPTGPIACVGDSQNIYDFCEKIVGGALREAILARDGFFVVRPDSGDPHEVLPRVLAILWDKFGGTLNDKGFKVLDPHIRVIQGDGITDETVGTILETIMAAGWSADNLAFGSGGGLLQKLDRDTQRFAFKCCEVMVNGNTYDVFKKPSTDLTKSSKAGNLKLVSDPFVTFATVRMEDPGSDELGVVFANGDMHGEQTLEEIRGRAI